MQTKSFKFPFFRLYIFLLVFHHLQKARASTQLSADKFDLKAVKRTEPPLDNLPINTFFFRNFFSSQQDNR